MSLQYSNICLTVSVSSFTQKPFKLNPIISNFKLFNPRRDNKLESSYHHSIYHIF